MSAIPVPAVSSGAKTRWVIYVKRLLFMAMGCVIALVIAEIGLRAMHLAPALGISTVSAKDFARLPGIYAPHQYVRDLQKPALPFTVTIDSLGFRGAEFTRTKPANQLRVVMLGDSYVYGDFVDDEQTLPVQLEQRLRKACGDVLVINGGVGGTTIIDQAPMLQRMLPLSPDAVVLVYVVDDFANLANEKSSWDLLAENRVKKSRFPLSVLYPVLRNTALWNLALKFRATRINQETATNLKQAFTEDRSATSSRLRDRYGVALIAMRDTLKAHGIPFVFTMYPASKELPASSENLKWIEQFAASQGIPEVNFRDALRASSLPDTALYQLPEDGHPDARGYAIAAEPLAQRLLASMSGPACKR